MRDVMRKVQVNMPYQMLIDEHLPLVIREKLNPEIGFNCFVLDRFTTGNFIETARILSGAGVNVTFHAPFFDLRPGALDRKVREVTKDRLKQVFDLIPYYTPSSVVCHPSYDERYYVSNEEAWLENSRDTWAYFLTLAEEMNTVIALENVYEGGPHYIARLIEALPASPNLSFCFDTGHFNVFSEEPLKAWLDRLGPAIRQVHLHDNGGSRDDHLPVGEGTFPFRELFEYLKTMDSLPLITLEPHNEPAFRRTMENIGSMGLFGQSQ